MAAADSDDPVYSKSTFLTSYMSNHADTLVAYICHQLGQQSKRARGGKVAATEAKDVKEPRMLKITSNEMELQYKDANDGLAVKTVSLLAMFLYDTMFGSWLCRWLILLVIPPGDSTV